MRTLPLILALLLLSACLPQKPVTDHLTWQTRHTRLQAFQTWQARGTLAFSDGQKGMQAHFDWRNHPGAFELTLSGPMGIRKTTFIQKGEQAWLKTKKMVEAIPSIEGYVQDAYGMTLPIEALHHWLQGRPMPGRASHITKNAQGQLQTLSQAGWHIVYRHYGLFQSLACPTQLVATQSPIRLNVLVRTWTWGVSK